MLYSFGPIVALIVAAIAWLLKPVPIEKHLRRDIARLPRSLLGSRDELLEEKDLDGFPEMIQDYIRFTGAVGKPLVYSYSVGFSGDFALKIGSPYVKVRTVQFNSGITPLRLFYIYLRIGGLPLYGRDSYYHGEGRMWGKLLGLIKVFDERGMEFRIGELTTYLNDALLLCPATLVNLKDRLQWEEMGQRRLRVTFTDCGLTVSAELEFNEHHVLTNFITTDRYCENPNPGKDRPRYIQAKWSTPLDPDWQEIGGRKVPTRGRALWHLTEPGFCYADFRIDSFLVNAKP